jgi:uridine phosphorylase
MPEHCVLTFFNDIVHELVSSGEAREIACLKSEIGRNPVYLFEDEERPVALLHPGVGAPLAAGFLEEAIALGGRKFIACGGAGTLDCTHEVGRIIVPISAVRDEGTSYHYLLPSNEVEPTGRALESLISFLNKSGVPCELAKTWTTDAIYRETRAKIKRRIDCGCKSVEMEAAALFAVARFRGVELAQILYAGDDLSGEHWDSRNWSSHLEIRKELLRLSIRAVLQI